MCKVYRLILLLEILHDEFMSSSISRFIFYVSHFSSVTNQNYVACLDSDVFLG